MAARGRPKTPRSHFAEARRLLEHQTMDTISNLRPKRVAALQEEFARGGGALDRLAFATLLHAYLPEEVLVQYSTLPRTVDGYGEAVTETLRPSVEQRVATLGELFDEVDTEGAGTITWAQVEILLVCVCIDHCSRRRRACGPQNRRRMCPIRRH